MTWALAAAALFLAAAAICWALCWLVRVVAPKVGLVDIPGGRKAHRAPTPLGGGIAIWLAVGLVLAAGTLLVGPGRTLLPASLAIHASGSQLRAGTIWLLYGLATAIMVMGLADDARGLSWRLRLGVQFGLATVLALLDVRVTLFGPLSNPAIGGLITVLWIAGLTNSFNFLDNMDGLAGTVALVAALLLAGALVAVQSLFVPAILLVIAGALAGFLIHNRYPARLFMGDAGSNFLGFMLASLCVLGTFTRTADGPDTPYGVLAPLLVMAVPLYDTFTVILIRLREGRSPFQADRRHFSHRLVERGLTAPQAVRTIALVSLACGLGAPLLHRLNGAGAAILIAQALCMVGVIAVLERSELAPRIPAPSPDGPAISRAITENDATG